MNVCPRDVGVSASTSFPEPFLPQIGASGILQLPYENVDVYSDSLSPDNENQMPVATSVFGWEANSLQNQ